MRRGMPRSLRHTHPSSARSLALLVALGILACSRTPEPGAETLSLVPAERGFLADLGYGYDSRTGSFVGSRCLEWIDEPRWLPKEDLSATVAPESDVQALDLVRRLSGALSVGYPVYPGVEAGANVEMATTYGNTEVAVNQVFTQSIRYQKSLPDVRPTAFLIAQRERAAALGLSGLETSEFLAQRCGDEYVQSVSFGASVTAIVGLNFGSEANLRKMRAGLSLTLLGGIAKIEAAADLKQEEVSESIELSVAVKQVGGKPQELVKLLPNGFPRCRYDRRNDGWAKDCEAALTLILRYVGALSPTDMQDVGIVSFPQQVRDGDAAFVPLAFETAPYRGDELRGLERAGRADGPTPVALRLSDDGDAGLRVYFEAAIKLASLRQTLHGFLEGRTTAPGDPRFAAFFQSAVEELAVIDRFARALAARTGDCWKDMRLCTRESALAELARLEHAYPYDPDVADYGRTIPSIKEWCELLGPVDSGRFPQSRLLPADEAPLLALFAMASQNPASAAESGTAALVEARCQELDAYVSFRLGEGLRLDKSTTFNQQVTSLRPLDHLPGMTVLTARNQNLHRVPRFYGLDRLRILDLADNKGMKMDSLDLGAIRKLPSSLECLDLSRSTGGALDAGALLEVSQAPILFARGLIAARLPDATEVERIYLREVDLAPEALLAAGAVLPRRLTIKAASLTSAPAGSYGNIVLESDDLKDSCLSLSSNRNQ